MTRAEDDGKTGNRGGYSSKLPGQAGKAPNVPKGPAPGSAVKKPDGDSEKK